MRVEVIGTLAASPPRFASVVIEVSAEYADADLFAHLVHIAENGCMVNTLKRGLDFSVRTGAPT